MSRTLFKTALALALALGGSSAMATDSNAEIEISRAIDKALINVLSGQAPLAQPMLIERPERQRVELGAVVDVRTADANGLPVLAVTPGSAADRIGLKVGDRLLAINDSPVTTSLDPGPVLTAAVAAGDGELLLKVQRGDQQLNLEGSADLVSIPAYTLTIQPSITQKQSGCGVVSGGARLSRPDVRKVEIVKVDGEIADTNFVGRVRLPAGLHRLTVRPLPLPGVGGSPTSQVVGSNVMRSTHVPGSGGSVNNPTTELQMIVVADMSYQIGVLVGQPGKPMQAYIASATAKSCGGTASAR